MSAGLQSDVDTGRWVDSTRSERLAADLLSADAGGRAVAFTGQVGDVLVAPGGNLVRLPEFLAEVAAGRGATLVHVSGDRATTLAPPRTTPVSDLNAAGDGAVMLLRTLQGRLAGRAEPVWVVLDHAAEELAEDPRLMRFLVERAIDPAFANHRLMALFRTSAPPADLLRQPGWTTVDVPLPDRRERDHLLHRVDARTPVSLTAGLELERVAALAGGLTADALRRLLLETHRMAPLSEARVVIEKTAEIRRVAGESLEVLTAPGQRPEIAGMMNLRLLAQRCRATGTLPGVIMLAGPPGVGKTASFAWLAHELGIPAVRLGQVRSSFVGDSERAMQRARQVLTAMAPVALLRDEAEMQDGDGHDGGVSARLRAEWLDLLNAAPKLGIVVVMTTNDPQGGFDERIRDRARVLPVLHPSVQEAGEIAAIEARRLGLWLDQDAIEAAVATRPHGMISGRALTRLVEEAAQLAALAGHPRDVTATDIAAAWHDQLDFTDAEGHELKALESLLLAGNRVGWPWVAARRMGAEPVALPPYLRNLVGPDGEPDLTRMHERVRQLRAARRG